jgi:S1-C subfamily serine protease
MRRARGIAAFTAAIGISTALAQSGALQVLKAPPKMMIGSSGAPVVASPNISPAYELNQLQASEESLPTGELAKIARQKIFDAPASTRGAKDIALYRSISPSVVLVATKEGLGSGAIVSGAGEIITNWHVIKGYPEVGVVFKPAVEGKQINGDDLKVARVVKYDVVGDLALIKVSEVPSSRAPIRLGSESDISIGADVHAIGHPTGAVWTYTTGVISQYRMGFEWRTEGTSHKADVIQTLTPINPGNS